MLPEEEIRDQHCTRGVCTDRAIGECCVRFADAGAGWSSYLATRHSLSDMLDLSTLVEGSRGGAIPILHRHRRACFIVGQEGCQRG